MRRVIATLVALTAVSVVLAECSHSVSKNDVPMPEALNTRALVIIMDGPVAILSHDSLSNRDNIMVQADVVKQADIYAYFRRHYTGTASRSIIIKAAPTVKYGTVLIVMDAAVSAGLQEIGFAHRVRGGLDDQNPPAGFEKFVPLKVRTPTLERHGAVVDQHPIVVAVDRNDRIWIDRKRSSSSTLYPDMAKAVAFHAVSGYSKHISLIADADADWETIIKIMDAGSQAGDDDIGFVTQ